LLTEDSIRLFEGKEVRPLEGWDPDSLFSFDQKFLTKLKMWKKNGYTGRTTKVKGTKRRHTSQESLGRNDDYTIGTVGDVEAVEEAADDEDDADYMKEPWKQSKQKVATGWLFGRGIFRDWIFKSVLTSRMWVFCCCRRVISKFSVTQYMSLPQSQRPIDVLRLLLEGFIPPVYAVGR
jgi:hypothetical protein